MNIKTQIAVVVIVLLAMFSLVNRIRKNTNPDAAKSLKLSVINRSFSFIFECIILLPCL